MSCQRQPSFRRFSQLPCELRLKIWQDSLPASEGNAVYFFRDWKWNPHIPHPSTPSPLLLQTDDDDDDGPEHDVVNPHVPINLPQVLVNREARETALRWAARRHITLQIHERAWDEDRDAGGRIVVRPWQPLGRDDDDDDDDDGGGGGGGGGDAVYVGSDKWDEFCERPCTFPFDGRAAVAHGTADCGYHGGPWSSSSWGSSSSSSSGSSPWRWWSRPSPRGVEIRALAVPAGDVRGRELAGLLHCLPNLERLLLVYGALPQPYEREEEPLVPRRWALAPAATAAHGGVRPYGYTDAPHGGGRYAPRGGGRYAPPPPPPPPPREGEGGGGEQDAPPLVGAALAQHVEEVGKMLLGEVKRCEVESEARDAVERDEGLPFVLEAVVLVRGH